MKFGYRTPSIKKSVKSRTTGKINRAVKRATTPMYGKKGTGIIKNPSKKIYNKVYKKTTFGISDIIKAEKGNNDKNQINYSYNYTNSTKRKKVSVPIGEHKTTLSEKITLTIIFIILFLLSSIVIIWLFSQTLSSIFIGIIISICFAIMVYLIILSWKQETTKEYKTIYEDELSSENSNKIHQHAYLDYESDSNFKNNEIINSIIPSKNAPEFKQYAIAVFLNAYKKGSPILKNNEYYKYLKNECSIDNIQDFHKQLIDEEYFVYNKENNKFILSAKGKDFLINHNDCVKIHSYQKYGLNWQEYLLYKQCNTNLTFDEIIWRILDNRFIEHFNNGDYGLARNIELYRAEISEKTKEYKQAFYYYVLVFYFDLSGCGNNNYIYSFETVKSDATNYAPGITKKLRKYSEYYSDELVNSCFEIKLPNHYYDINSFKNELLKQIK